MRRVSAAIALMLIAPFETFAANAPTLTLPWGNEIVPAHVIATATGTQRKASAAIRSGDNRPAASRQTCQGAFGRALAATRGIAASVINKAGSTRPEPPPITLWLWSRYGAMTSP